MKFYIKIFLALTVLTIALNSVKGQSLDLPSRYNQKETFPNQFEAATNTTALDSANYTSPFMSQVLFENDPKRKLRKHEFLTYLRFTAYRITRGEAEQIFSFADGNRDDLLDQEEWNVFSGLYIFPFESCDRDHDYLLDEKEFADCFDKDPRSRHVIFRRRDQQDRHAQIMWTLTSRTKPLLNFHDYMFIRRALFAWKNCQSNAKYIAKSQFKCAMKTAILQKLHFTIELENIYDAGIMMSGEKNIIELDFINYLRTMYATYLFANFGEPINIPFIEKTQFLKAIKEDRLPTNFEEKEINTLFDLINTNPLLPVTQMNFRTFAFFLNLHRLFNKYSSERPLLLTKHEFLTLLKDKLTPAQTVYAIDVSHTHFKESQYLEASLVLQRKRPNEGNYFFSFKQDASENTASMWNATTVNNTYYNFVPNNDAREVFFTSFAEVNKDVWTKENYYRAFQLANLFTSMIPDWRFVISSTSFVDNLMNQYELVDPPINFIQRKNYPMYKLIPREIYLDILIFVTIENFRIKFESHLKSSNQLIYESYAKLILMDFGMNNMPDTVLDLAKKGFDNLRRRQYDPFELIKYCVIVHSVASENQRSKEFDTKYKIKTNHDDSRRFPGWPRRSQASPWV